MLIDFEYFENYYIGKGLAEKVIKIFRNLDIYNQIQIVIIDNTFNNNAFYRILKKTIFKLLF